MSTKDIEGTQTADVFSLEKTFTTPAHVSSLAFGHPGQLYAGSDDGSLRIYDLSTSKVLKAVRGLGNEVSSIICIKRPGSELRDAWVAHGKRISLFQLDSPKLIQSPEDALSTVDIGNTEDASEIDTLNELSLNSDKSHLAFSMDSGAVGVVKLATKEVVKMKTGHESVCGSVKCVPGRPQELVSGGYDRKLQHYDYTQGDVLSSYLMELYAQNGGSAALAPPFVMSLAVSPSGVLAAGTADGRLWLGFGGEKKVTGAKRKKGKKWGGLDEDETLLIKIAEGPIVAMAFSEARALTISTLMGVLTHYHLEYNPTVGQVVLKQLWQRESEGIQKVNALIADEKRFIVGGFTEKGQGIIEVWRKVPPQPEADTSKVVLKEVVENQ
ncbi:hypothetical protein K443DRAFT_535773 [Laccaria amethystina LaAM-08-1]|uniref:WD40 repeat-like protein n=1 Tax=Laccaria amethystina LaAM-08-1 TaxID=1095629 RepID=A0A0C9Y4C1_9AGAR|nr:hypothetical protein K443DRAFT_535773 [Laccaria amethystina LaAM-08-1]